MKSRIILLTSILSAALLGTSCGSDGHEKIASSIVLVGDEPSFFSSGFTSGARLNDDTTVLVDDSSNQIQVLDHKTFKIRNSLANPFPGQNVSIVVDDKINFMMVSSQSDFAIVKKNGDVLKNPVEIFSDISAMGYSAAKNLLLIENQDHEITVLGLDEDGDVTQKWLAGPFIDGMHSIRSASFADSTGYLFAVLTNGKVIKVDLAESLSLKKWKYETLVKLQNVEMAAVINWMTLTEDEKYLFVESETHLIVASALDGELLSNIPLGSQSVLRRSAQGTPHIGMTSDQNEGALKVVYIDKDGTFRERHILSRSKHPEVSIVDVEKNQIILSFRETDEYEDYPSKQDSNDFAKRTIERIRLSDGRNLDRTEIGPQSRVILGPKDFIVQFASLLGHLEKRNYGKKPQTVTLKGFNLQHLRKK